MFVYKLSGSGFESSCSRLNFRFRVCVEQWVPWYSGNYRVWTHSEMRTWHDKNIVIKITENDHYWTMSISPETDYEIHLKRSPGSFFVNSHNPVLHKAWEANLDIQPVQNSCKELRYMTTYFSKSESESRGTKTSCKKYKRQNPDKRDVMKNFTYSFINASQLSVQ